MPCPNCGGIDTVAISTARNVRKIVGLDDVSFLYGRRFECKPCKTMAANANANSSSSSSSEMATKDKQQYTFNNYDSRVLALLPKHILLLFPVLLTAKYGCTTEVLDTLTSLCLTGTSVLQFSKAIRQRHSRRWMQMKLMYFSAVSVRRDKREVGWTLRGLPPLQRAEPCAQFPAFDEEYEGYIQGSVRQGRDSRTRARRSCRFPACLEAGDNECRGGLRQCWCHRRPPCDVVGCLNPLQCKGKINRSSCPALLARERQSGV